jgi:MinD superfamily P-loop ATPase
MSFKIAIASGKGGTGKTTVSVNLFHYLKSIFNEVQLADCDVEEPDDLIFFPDAAKLEERIVFQSIPVIDKQKCSYCRKCVSWCEFNAIVVLPGAGFAEINPALCHSCNACVVACKDGAISEHPLPIGSINYFETPGGLKITEGRLKIGSAMQTMVIKELKKQLVDAPGIIIFDAPPGTSCPVVQTIIDVDYVILVTEPTPFGLHDLKLMTALLDEVGKPYGVIVNKSGLGNRQVYDYLGQNDIELLGEIPFSMDYASSYATGNLFTEVSPVITAAYEQIMIKLRKKILRYPAMAG